MVCKHPSRLEQYTSKFENTEYSNALNLVAEVISETNIYWQASQPWKLTDSPSELNTVLHLTYESLRICSILMLPVMPNKMAVILDTFAIANDDRFFENAVFGKGSKGRILKSTGSSLFPRIK